MQTSNNIKRKVLSDDEEVQNVEISRKLKKKDALKPINNNIDTEIIEIVSSDENNENEVDKENDSIQKRGRYSLGFKDKIINYANFNTITAASNKFKIQRTLISKWVKNSSTEKKIKTKKSRFKHSSNNERAKFPTMEIHLLKWVKDKRDLGACISGFSMQQKAIELFRDSYGNVEETMTEFKASNGWLTNFCKRRNLVLRRITTKGREAPKNATLIIKNFFKQCQQLVNIENYKPEEIINMDETSIYLDFPSNYTFSEKGAKKVKCTTTGNERTRISAAFSATASGQKLPILLVVPRVIYC